MSNVIVTEVDVEFTPVAGYFLLAVNKGVVVLQKKLKDNDKEWPWIHVASCGPESMLDVMNKSKFITYRVRKISDEDPDFKVIMTSGLDGKDISNPLTEPVKQPKAFVQPDMHLSYDKFTSNVTLGNEMVPITVAIFGQTPNGLTGESPKGVHAYLKIEEDFHGVKGKLMIQGRPQEATQQESTYTISGENDKQAIFKVKWNVVPKRELLSYKIVKGSYNLVNGSLNEETVAVFSNVIGDVKIHDVKPDLHEDYYLDIKENQLVLSGQSYDAFNQLYNVRCRDDATGDTVDVIMSISNKGISGQDTIPNT